MTAPKSLRELFDQIGLQEVSSTDGTVAALRRHDDVIVVETGGNWGYAGVATETSETTKPPRLRGFW